MRQFWCVALVAVAILAIPALIRADEQAEAKAVIDKAIKAHGGKEALNKYKAANFKMKGKVHVMGMAIDFTGEWWTMAPDKMKYAMDIEVGNVKLQQTQVINGKQGWVWNSMANATTEIPEDMMAEAKEEIHFREIESLAPLSGKGYEFAPLGENKVGDSPVVGVQVKHKGFRDVNLWFDKANYHLLRSEVQAKDYAAGGKEVHRETFYSNFKEVEGMPMPMHFMMKHDGQDFLEGDVTEMKPLESLDDSIFVKP